MEKKTISKNGPLSELLRYEKKITEVKSTRYIFPKPCNSTKILVIRGYQILWIILLLLFVSCEGPEEYRYVDFSRKIKNTHQNKRLKNKKILRVAVAAMVSPKETIVYYEEILKYIGEKVGYEIQLIQRKTYSEVNELFLKRSIDIAFICSGPYATGKKRFAFEGLATPVVRGKPFYQSYLIVHKDSSYKTLEELKGKIFAFTDPDSNTGSLVPHYWLSELNQNSTSFFKRTTYTYSHDNSIMAVAKGLVDGASVDGHKWEFYNTKNPYFTSKTRVIKKSDFFGSPPLVASSSLDSQLKSKIQKTVLSMHNTDKGKGILKNLLIDQFLQIQDGWYRKVQDMHKKVR